MKLRYSNMMYECPHCGKFVKNITTDVHETITCKCGRTSTFVEGMVSRIKERERLIPKTQKKLVVEV